MLITKEVQISLNANNIKYFENLGYELPKKIDKWHKNKSTVSIGTKINVKVNDLKNSSTAMVDVKCDNCGCIVPMEWRKYNISLNEEGKFYCSWKDNGCIHKILYSGENNPNWNSNITDIEREIKRNTNEYTEWVKKVLARDNYTCQCCGKKSHDNNLKIEAHHLDGWNWCKEKRYDETNGITLCENCHKNFHNKYGTGGNTKEQFEEWIGYAVEVLKCQCELPTARKVYCIEENKVYNSAEEVKTQWNLKSNTSIYRVCSHEIEYKNRKNSKDVEYIPKTVKGKHLLWLDEYEKMSKEDIEKYLEWCKPKTNKRSARKVICKTTNKIFNSAKEGAKYYNCNSAQITKCCKGYGKYSGRLTDGTILEWEYFIE